MILKTLRLKNFRSFADGRVDFGEHQNYVVGANWQGKSSLVEGVAFALFGKEALPRRVAGSTVTAEDLVTDGASTAEVELAFVLDEMEYSIRRTLPRSGVRLTRDGTEIASGHEPVKEKLRDLLAIDAKFFANVFYADQDELRRSFDLSPKDRQTFIEALMGQEVWRARLDGLRKAQNYLVDFSQGLERGRFGAFLEQHKRLEAAITSDKEQLRVLNEDMASLKQRRRLAEKATGTDERRVAKLEERSDALATETLLLTRMTRDLAKGKCPTCTQTVPAGLRRLRLADLRRVVRANEKELRRIQRDLDALSGDEDVDTFTEEDRDDLNNLAGQLTSLGREHEHRCEDLRDLRKQEKAYGKTPGQHERAVVEIEFLKKLATVIDEHRAALRQQVANELVTAMNELLARFHDGDFDAEAVIGSDMDLTVKQHGRTAPLTYLSGAQKDAFAIALRYGLMRVAARHVDCMILDEPTRHMDPRNVRQLKSVFNDIADRQIVVVTVQEEFSDARGRHFIVTKNERLQSRVDPC